MRPYPSNERSSARTVSRAKTQRNRAYRRHQDQQLASLGRALDEELADRIESMVFHRRPKVSAEASPVDLGRQVAAMAKRRTVLKERTARRGRSRLDLDELVAD